MAKLPPVEHIQVFITNRRKWGWTDAYIASELRKRLGWDELDVAGMNEGQWEISSGLRDVLWALGEAI